MAIQGLTPLGPGADRVHPPAAAPWRIVTGEAVVLELRLAQLPSRALALALDLAVQLVLLVVATAVLTPALVAEADEAVQSAVLLLVSIGALVGYPVLCETLSRGRSLGKLAFGLRVVRDDGGPIRMRQALVRGLVGFVEFFLTFGSAALLTSLLSPTGKRLGDLLAGTVVLRDRMPAVRRAPVTMPPPLAGWAARADLSGLSPATAYQARELLRRWYTFDPAARDELARTLVADVAASVAPPPPTDAPAWALLSAVLAERQRRELLR